VFGEVLLDGAFVAGLVGCELALRLPGARGEQSVVFAFA